MKVFKEFEVIEKGDLGENYKGDMGYIVDFGTAKEMTEYDNFDAVLNLINGGIISENKPAVAVFIYDQIFVYMYGEHGFRCYKTDETKEQSTEEEEDLYENEF